MDFNVFVATDPGYAHIMPIKVRKVRLPVKDVDKELINLDRAIVGYEAPFEIESRQDLRKLNALAKLLEEMYWSIESKNTLPMPEIYVFNENFFNEQNILDVDNPMSILKASVFGNIDFDDLYITFDNNENLKSLNAEDVNNILEENKFDIINRYCYEHDLLSFDDDKKIR